MRKSVLIIVGGALAVALPAPFSAPALANPPEEADTSWFNQLIDKMLTDPDGQSPENEETRSWLARMQAWLAGLSGEVTEEELKNMPEPPPQLGGDTNRLVERERTDQEYRREIERLKARPTHDEQFAKELGISVEEFREHERRLAEKTAKDLGIDVEELERTREQARLQTAMTKEERLREEARKAVEILNGRDPQLPGSESPPSNGGSGSQPRKASRPCPPGPGSCVSPQ